MVDPDLLDVLRCPGCGGAVAPLVPGAESSSLGGSRLLCRGCSLGFPVRDGVPDMRVTMRDAAWTEKQARLDAWWRDQRGRPERTPAQPWRPAPEVVAAYLDLGDTAAGTGRLLDVGCGEGERGNHFPTKRYHGIDAVQRRDRYRFPIVVGMAECLPFREAGFDAVLSVEVLDHVVDPGRCLTEAVRVLAPGGRLFVFVGTDGGGGGRATYRTSEAETHTHALSWTFVESVLAPRLQGVGHHRAGGYLACWGRKA